jgi:hypothetical protein
VERYFQSFRDGDFAANAELVDPRALEELRASMARLVEFAGDPDELRETFGVGTSRELLDLEARELYQRMLRHALGGGEIGSLLATAELRVLGHVPEGTDHAHVVYRLRLSHAGAGVEQVQVAPLRRTPEGWRVMLTGTLAGMLDGSGRP